MGLIKGDIITEGPAGVAFSARARAPELGLSGDTELKKARGGDGFIYKSLAGDRKPPLDYRK